MWFVKNILGLTCQCQCLWCHHLWCWTHSWLHVWSCWPSRPCWGWPLAPSTCPAVQLELYLSFLDNFFVYGVLGQKSEYTALLFLTNSVSSVHSLKIHLRIPITVIKDDNISCVQVDTKTTSPRASVATKILGRFWGRATDTGSMILKLLLVEIKGHDMAFCS